MFVSSPSCEAPGEAGCDTSALKVTAHLLVAAMETCTGHAYTCSTLLSLAVICRMPHGLPLVLYLPRVESWAFSQVDADQAGEASAIAAAADRQMQQPADFMPFRYQTSLPYLPATMLLPFCCLFMLDLLFRAYRITLCATSHALSDILLLPAVFGSSSLLALFSGGPHLYPANLCVCLLRVPLCAAAFRTSLGGGEALHLRAPAQAWATATALLMARQAVTLQQQQELEALRR